MKRISLKKFALFFVFILISLCVLYLALQKPSNNRDWAEEVAVMPIPSITGDDLTITHIRDWQYNKDGPVSKNYIDRTYQISQVEQVWFLIEPFSGWDGVAHTYFVFDFKHQEPLAFSVESRREKGVGFSPLKGLFRSYDLIYLWGTEQDFTTGRVLHQKNEIYMFPLKTSADFNQKLLIHLTQKTSHLLEHPQFYNTLTDNCTSTLADLANEVRPESIPFHYARVLPGYSGQLLYDLGYLDNSMPYEELKEKYRITDIVKETKDLPDFSEQLRKRLDYQRIP